MKRKTSMNYLDVLVWCHRNEHLKGSSVQNVYYDKGLLWIKLKPKGAPTTTLVIEPGRRVNLTASPPEAPERLHPFAGGLRKYLRGSRVTGLRTLGYDRILEFTFSKGGDEYKLVAELVPRGVAVLLSPSGKILYANEYKEMRDRKIKRGEKYVPPPSPNFDPFNDLEQLIERVKKGKDIVRGLVIGQKLPADVAEEVLYRAEVKKNKKPKELSNDEIERIKKKIREVYNEAMIGQGYLAYSDDKPFAVEPFRPTLLESEGLKVVKVEDFNDALDKYFSVVSSEEIEADVEEMVRKELERIKRAIEKQKTLAEQYKELSEQYNNIATVLAANYAEVMETLSKGERKIKIGDTEVEIPKNTSLDEYIRTLFAKSKEYEKKYKRALKAIDELKRELEHVEEKVKEEIFKERAKHRRKEWYEKYHWLITRSGYLAIGGRDASQNEAIVRRYLEDNDYFLHAEIQGAPAVVLKAGGEVSEEDLRDAAYLTACYSKAWKSGSSAVDVFYVRGSQVSKTPPSGQYVAKGAFIIKGKRGQIRSVPLRLAIGVEVKDGQPKVIVGPEDLVSMRAVAYAVLVPGDTDKRKVAQKLKKSWASKMPTPELRGLIEGLKEDELVARIPGKSKIIRLKVPVKKAELPNGEEKAGLD